MPGGRKARHPLQPQWLPRPPKAATPHPTLRLHPRVKYTRRLFPSLGESLPCERLSCLESFTLQPIAALDAS